MTNHTAHILVVDDNRMNRLKLSRTLQRLGHQVAVAKNGYEALELLQKQAFDLVLLDLVMPELDGYQVLQRMKQHSTLKKIPVVIISALDDMTEIMECLKLGASDYLPKRVDPLLLQARLGTLLENKRLRNQQSEYQQQLTHLSHLMAEIQPQGPLPPELLKMCTRPDEWGELAHLLYRTFQTLLKPSKPTTSPPHPWIGSASRWEIMEGPLR